MPEGEPPVAYPMYGAGPGKAIKRLFTRWNRFKGRSSRSEFWWVFLFSNILFGILYALMAAVNGVDEYGDPQFSADTPGQLAVTVVFLAVALVLLVPVLAVSWRRLHDAGFAGPWYFINIIPFFGTIAFLVMAAVDTRPNKMKAKWEDSQVLKSEKF